MNKKIVSIADYRTYKLLKALWVHSMRKKGYTLSAIGKKLRVTTETVRQKSELGPLIERRYSTLVRTLDLIKDIANG